MSKKGILRRFGHVKHKDDVDWIEHCTAIQVDRVRHVGGTRKIRWDGVKEDTKTCPRGDVLIHSEYNDPLTSIYPGQLLALAVFVSIDF